MQKGKPRGERIINEGREIKRERVNRMEKMKKRIRANREENEK